MWLAAKYLGLPPDLLISSQRLGAMPEPEKPKRLSMDAATQRAVARMGTRPKCSCLDAQYTVAKLGRPRIEVTRVRITDSGRAAIGSGPYNGR